MGWAAPSTLGCMVLASVLLGVVWVGRHRGRDPLTPLRLLGYRELRMAMVLTAVFMSSFGVQYYFLALYYQQVYGYSVLQAGLAFLPATLVCTLGIWLAERSIGAAGVAQHPGQRAIGGRGGYRFGMCGVAHRGGVLVVAAGIFILSIGQGMTWTAMWVAAGLGIRPGEQGVAAGMASTSQQIGGALGLAVLVSVANAGGIELALWWSAAIALVGAVLVLALKERHPMSNSSQQAHI